MLFMSLWRGFLLGSLLLPVRRATFDNIWETLDALKRRDAGDHHHGPAARLDELRQSGVDACVH